MPRITDYSFLFQSMFGTSRMNLVNNIQLSQINSSSVQAQLKAAGIMYSEPLKGYFCIWKILSCPLRGRTGK